MFRKHFYFCYTLLFQIRTKSLCKKILTPRGMFSALFPGYICTHTRTRCVIKETASLRRERRRGDRESGNRTEANVARTMGKENVRKHEDTPDIIS